MGGAIYPFQTTQGNRLSCRDQEGRRGSEEAVPGPSVFPSGEPGVSVATPQTVARQALLSMRFSRQEY